MPWMHYQLQSSLSHRLVSGKPMPELGPLRPYEATWKRIETVIATFVGLSHAIYRTDKFFGCHLVLKCQTEYVQSLFHDIDIE